MLDKHSLGKFLRVSQLFYEFFLIGVQSKKSIKHTKFMSRGKEPLKVSIKITKSRFKVNLWFYEFF